MHTMGRGPSVPQSSTVGARYGISSPCVKHSFKQVHCVWFVVHQHVSGLFCVTIQVLCNGKVSVRTAGNMGALPSTVGCVLFLKLVYFQTPSVVIRIITASLLPPFLLGNSRTICYCIARRQLDAAA